MLVSKKWNEMAASRFADYLASRYSATRLGPDDIAAAGFFGDFADAWLLDLPDRSELPPFTIGISPSFPSSLPKIAIAPPSKWFLKIPHIERNGTVCILPEHATVDQSRMEGVIDDIIERAILTVRSGIEGSNRNDFINEIESYWESESDEKVGFLWFIGDPTLPSRKVTLVRQRRFTLIGDSPEQCDRWLRNYYVVRRTNWKFERGLLIVTRSAFYPDQYFHSNGDVFDFLAQQHPVELDQLASLADDRRWLPVIIQAPSTNGCAFLGVFLENKSPRKSRGFNGMRIQKPHLHGYRAGHIPTSVFAARFGKDPCRRYVINRAYPEWIHSRGGGGFMEMVSNKSVVVIGAGSLGSEVACMLCKSGLKNLKIVDHEVLSMDNIGRHLLGAKDVGYFKSEAVANYLRAQFPHANITSERNMWQAVAEDEGEGSIFDCDLILSLTGEWSSDSALNMECRARVKPPVIFGWTEPHGHAGHALLVAPRGGCLICGRDAFGEVLNKVTVWPQSQLKAIPACGGFYQPYGAVETAPIKSMISSFALSVIQNPLNTSELRSWLGNRELIEDLGGSINDMWKEYYDDPKMMVRQVRQPWEAQPTCPQCSGS